MSNYMFAPMPPTLAENNTFVTWENGFSEEELNLIEEYCSKLALDKATLADKSKDVDYADTRISDTAWIDLNEETGWFYDKLAFIARQLNSQFYRFDLYGFMESMQYTVYDGDVQAHYEWHIDSGGNTDYPRKLSMVLQLSDPKDYEGGELLLLNSKDADVSPKAKGLVTAFPSFRLHKVTPVTKGVRKSIVVWITGPAFK